MFLIGDIGGSKSDWALIHHSGQTTFIETTGFNPYTHSSEEYIVTLKNAFSNIDTRAVKKVFYYGTGTGKENARKTVHSILHEVFPLAITEVYTDLFGAARATCQHSKGIGCILGTGANSGLYDGNTITDSVPTLGYLAGDEGSGSNLGKLIIKAYFYRDMPSDLTADFETIFPGRHEFILNGLYHRPPANQFLGSFTVFAHKWRSHPFMAKLIHTNFQEFINTQLSKYTDYQTLPIHFCGSVAHYFQKELRACLLENSCTPGTILAKPLAKLIEFHTHEKNS